MKINRIIVLVYFGFMSSQSFAAEEDPSGICSSVTPAECTKIFNLAVEKLRAEITSSINMKLSDHNSDKDAHKEAPEPFKSKDFFLSKLTIKSELGLTNSNAHTFDGGGSVIETKIENETVRNIKFGYFGKPIFTEFRKLNGINTEENKSFFDDFKFSLYTTYGTTITDPRLTDDLKTETKNTFYVGLNYEAEVENVLGFLFKSNKD